MSLPLSDIDVVLVRPRESGNIGAVARVIANHGLGRLVLVCPPAFDPDRARWMAPGASQHIDAARLCGSVREALGGYDLIVAASARRRRWNWPHWGPTELVEACDAAQGRAAIVFGPEDAGLANEDLELADAILVLPTAPHASLNLAQAVAVTAAHLLSAARDQGDGPPGPERQRPRRGGGRQSSPPGSEPAAPAADQVALVEAAIPVVEESTWLRGRSAEQLHGTLYRLLRRARPSRRELNVLRGILSKLEWRLGPGDGLRDPDRSGGSS